MEAPAHSWRTDCLWRQTTMTIGTGIHEVSDRAAINICIGSDQPYSIQYVQYLVVIIRSPSPAVATGNRGTSCHGCCNKLVRGNLPPPCITIYGTLPSFCKKVTATPANSGSPRAGSDPDSGSEHSPSAIEVLIANNGMIW